MEVKDLHVGYDKEMDVLHGVSFHVEEQECIAFVGANGAGKSTLMNTLSGLLKPKSGTIEYCGQRLDGLPPHNIVEIGVILVPEEGGIFPSLSIEENLHIARRHGCSRAEEERGKERVYEFFPALREKYRKQASTLSGGQRKMLSVGKAIMGEPRLLLLDDISMGLAPKIVKELYAMLKELTSELKIPVIIVEQIVEIALNFGTRGYVMAQGQILLEDDAEALLKTDDVQKIYIGG